MHEYWYVFVLICMTTEYELLSSSTENGRQHQYVFVSEEKNLQMNQMNCNDTLKLITVWSTAD